MRHCDCADVRLAVDHRLLCALHMLPPAVLDAAAQAKSHEAAAGLSCP